MAMAEYVCKIEEAIGETRAAIYRGKNLQEVYLWRDSQAHLPRVGDIFVGKISKIEKQIMSAFIDLGEGNSGLLRFAMANSAPRLTEGQMLELKIKKSAEKHKSALVEFISVSNAKFPKKIKSVTMKDFIKTRFGEVKFINEKPSGISDLCEPIVPLAAGGSICIEHTQAGTMIDVDSQSAPKFKTAMEAVKMAAKQIRLRGIGGLILLDLPNLRSAKQRADVWQTFVDGFNLDKSIVKIAPMSRFGTIEMTRSKTGLPLAEICLDKCGQPTAETIALWGLRRLVGEAEKSGTNMVLCLPQNGYEWLNNNKHIWQDRLDDKIGKRYNIKSANSIDVITGK